MARERSFLPALLGGDSHSYEYLVPSLPFSSMLIGNTTLDLFSLLAGFLLEQLWRWVIHIRNVKVHLLTLLPLSYAHTTRNPSVPAFEIYSREPQRPYGKLFSGFTNQPLALGTSSHHLQWPHPFIWYERRVVSCLSVLAGLGLSIDQGPAGQQPFTRSSRTVGF